MTRQRYMTTLDERLREHAVATEAFLAAVLDQAEDVPERLRDAMRLALLGGGRRFCPFRVIESAARVGVAREHALRTAAALECLHCYSLVHDDLPAMDNDRTRRGKPTVWAAFDDWTAILAGDALLTLSFELIADAATHPVADVRNLLVAELARASGAAGMVGGQMLDLMSDKLSDPRHPDLTYIRKLQAMKTGALIRFACEAGAILGEADTAQRLAVRSFGENLGVVFQIADDLLDITGDAATVGKAVGKDATKGKATFVSVLGVERARDQANHLADQAINHLKLFDSKANHLRALARFVVERKH